MHVSLLLSPREAAEVRRRATVERRSLSSWVLRLIEADLDMKNPQFERKPKGSESAIEVLDVRLSMPASTRGRLERMAEAQERSVSSYVGVLISREFGKLKAEA